MNTSGATGVVWQRGKFQKFYAQMKIRVGGAAVPVDILAGDEFEFDGTILKYGGGEYTSPQTRGAINAGWATPNPEGAGPVRSHSHTRSIAKATSVNRDLNRVQRMEDSMDTDNSDEDTVMNVSDRRPQQTGKKVLNVPNDKAAPRVLRGGMAVNTDDLEPQEGVNIGRVRTSATLKADIFSTQAAQAAQRLGKIEGSGFIPEGSDRARGHNVLKSEGITVRTSVSGGRIDQVQMSDMDEGDVVGRVRKSQNRSVEGITVTDTSNIRDERARTERAPKAPVKAAAKSATKVAAKASAKADSSTAAKIKTARTVDPNFPEDWNFFAKLEDRIKAIKKNEKNRKFLLALFLVEGAPVRAHLQRTYPKVFS